VTGEEREGEDIARHSAGNDPMGLGLPAGGSPPGFRADVALERLIAAFLAAAKAGILGGKQLSHSLDHGIDLALRMPDGQTMVVQAKEYHHRWGYSRRDGTIVAPSVVRSPRRAPTVPRRRLAVFIEWYAAIRLLLMVLRLGGRAASGLTGLAVLLAGRKRAALRDEWRAHLAGESGHDPASWHKARQAAGFLLSAIRYRCSDTTDAAWAVADAVLRSRPLSNLVVTPRPPPRPTSCSGTRGHLEW
jgi:hypothetical protein